MTKPESLLSRLRALVGASPETTRPARDPVNPAMIRHWCDAVGDENPIYTDPERAARTRHGGLVAPPTMLQAWTMPGLKRSDAQGGSSALGAAMALLDEAGFTSVVATNCEQEYPRYLRPGDELCVSSTLESISEEKRTSLGPGHFVTERMTFRDQRGEVVGEMRFRMLKFRPTATRAGAQPRRGRPRPGITRDNAFFWEGVRERALRIQRCASCGLLRHPPGPMCGHCRSLEWDTLEACGRGRVYSFVVAHHPPVPPFAYPNAIALIELEEGTRLVSNVVDVDPAEIAIGLPVCLEFREVEEGFVLPLFRPDPASGGSG